jgi:hypothetical protein
MDQTSPGWVKLLVYGSFCLNNQTAGAGIVLRDENDMPILWASHYLEDCLSPLEAELRACRVWSCLESRQHTHMLIIIESDCSQLVDVVISSLIDRSPFLHLVHENRSLASQFNESKFVKV